MRSLEGKIAVVTGASRGVGRGIAIGLGEAGATVYVSGRTLDQEDVTGPLPGNLMKTVEEVERAGGKGIAVRCDHTKDQDTEALFYQVKQEQGRIDILVNNAWGGYEHLSDGTKFWEEKGFWTAPVGRWDSMFEAGVRAHYVSSFYAAPIMVAQKSGLIINISAFSAFRDTEGVPYGVAKAADVRMAGCMANDLRPHNVAALALLPGLVRTESVMRAAEYLDLTISESPQYIGRVVVALAADPKIMEKSGKWFIAAEAGEDYGLEDIDGQVPKSLRKALLETKV